VGGSKRINERGKKMDYKASKRKILKSYEVKKFDQDRRARNTMQENLDRLGYETPKENMSADEYVKSLSW
jgi:hypothetical protein